MNLSNWYIPNGIRLPQRGWGRGMLPLLIGYLRLHGLTVTRDGRNWLIVTGGSKMCLQEVPAFANYYDLYDDPKAPTEVTVRRYLPTFRDYSGELHKEIELCWGRPLEDGERPHFTRDRTMQLTEAHEGIRTVSPWHSSPHVSMWRRE
jgi:hypothetical protein